ncbi:MAG TPA: hypothetical protein VF759_14190 [Allosphingosinicella sp.]|jgi:hypothetical protein
MDPGAGTAGSGEQERLLAVLDRLHRRAMGIGMPAYGGARLAPLPFAAIWAGAYILVVGAAIALEHFGYSGAPSDPRFVGLLVWALVYSTAVMFFTRLATQRSLDIVRSEILPHATPAYVAAVADDLERRDSARTRWIVPLGVAIVVALVSTWAQANESPRIAGARFGPVRLLWTGIGLYLTFVAARGVLVGRFYEPFARRLDLARERFYVLGAAETPLVRGIAGLARQMLILWVMIFLAILSIMLLGVDLGPYGFKGRSPLLWFVVPSASFASLGYGSLVYLRSEAAIRESLRRFAGAQAEALQARINARLEPAADRLPDHGEEVERLSQWHDRILAGAAYGNRLAAALSFSLPFAMALLTLVRMILELG